MMRWFGYVIGCFVAGVVALNLYFFAAIASWQVFDPSSTSFMRAERMRLCGANVFTCKIDHRWVNYDQISRNLKRAVIASEDAVIGTPYSRMWGAYLTGMWLYRLSLAKAKWHSLTGRPLTGVQAAEIELINEAVPFERLEARVAEIAAELSHIPLSQLRAQKLIVNQAYENMGLASTQTLGVILDGLMRNTPDALDFINTAETQGVRAAVERRDGPFGDYSQAPPELRPDPTHIIVPDGDV